MTNQELMQEIKESRKEMNRKLESVDIELKELKKEFYVFKGKAIFFMGSVSIMLAFASDYIKKKIGI